jgi:hypothetical protein
MYRAREPIYRVHSGHVLLSAAPDILRSSSPRKAQGPKWSRASHLVVYCKVGRFLERVYLGALLCSRERYLCSCFPDIDRQLTILRVHMYFTVLRYARQQDTQAKWHGQ